ncbi:MAG: Dabb family protein [Bacteroidetes bacterium]|nr:Dabb family protein [Bacteroidota bacterium]
MIRHIVMFRLREYTTPEEKQKAIEALRNELLSMRKKIGVIRDFEVGVNFTMVDSAFDLVINSSFESHDALKAYQVHPDHQAFILFNKDYSVKKAIIDYEF